MFSFDRGVLSGWMAKPRFNS